MLLRALPSGSAPTLRETSDMAEPDQKRRNRLRNLRWAQQQAASQIHENREALSVGRRAMYGQGEYEPEPQRGNGPRPVTVAEVASIKERMRAGDTQEQVAKDLGLHLSSVARVCKVLGPSIREGKDDQVHSGARGWPSLLADHDAGLCGGDCRLGRHGHRL